MDKVVITKENIQSEDYLSAFIYFSVGRILLEKNPLIYTKHEKRFFIFVKLKNYLPRGSNSFARPVSLNRRSWRHLLSRFYSTIGVYSLNFSVRKGKRWILYTIDTVAYILYTVVLCYGYYSAGWLLKSVWDNIIFNLLNVGQRYNLYPVLRRTGGFCRVKS